VAAQGIDQLRTLPNQRTPPVTGAL
jgi:hypothetical protein